MERDFNISDIRQLFAEGADLSFIFGLSQTYLSWHNSSADDLAEAFQIFHAHGMSAGEIKKWIDDHFMYGLLDDLALDATGHWHEIGIDTTSYTEEFVRLNAQYYLDDAPQPPDPAADPQKSHRLYHEILRRAGAGPHVLARYEQ